MPSFDVVSEVELFEVKNAVDQANRELGQRYDFKNVQAQFELSDAVITLTAEVDFQLQQMLDIIRNKLTKRSIDIRAMTIDDPCTSGLKATQSITIQNGLETEMAKKITKLLKGSPHKVKAQIMQDKIRVDGKKRDDLQQTIAYLKGRQSELNIPLQFNNFRD